MKRGPGGELNWTHRECKVMFIIVLSKQEQGPGTREPKEGLDHIADPLEEDVARVRSENQDSKDEL